VTGGIGKRGNVVDGESVDGVLGPGVRDFESIASAHVLCAEVIEDEVVKAPAFPRQRRSA